MYQGLAAGASCAAEVLSFVREGHSQRTLFRRRAACSRALFRVFVRMGTRAFRRTFPLLFFWTLLPLFSSPSFVLVREGIG